jgi:hypothetical protein
MIVEECRKRVFWAACTLDTYLSVNLGRPPLIRVEDVDQSLPESIDDEDLTESGVLTSPPGRGESIMRAPTLHAQITLIVRKAACELHSVEKRSSSQKLEGADKLNAEISAWHDTLPAVFSSAVHPSSLAATLGRQSTVLRLAHAHAQMLINRPSLLLETTLVSMRDTQASQCVAAAKVTLDTVLAASLRKELFQAFWYTQLVSFTALSIIYIWLIRRKHERLPRLQAPLLEDELFSLARIVQQQLVDATECNAPTLRYNIVLGELQQEVVRTLQSHASPQMPVLAVGHGVSEHTAVTDGSGVTSSLMEAWGDECLFHPDLWLTLDSFPFSDLAQIE